MGRKRIFIGVAVAIAGLLIVGELLSGFLRLESQRRTIERKLSEAAGLAVSIGGDLRLHLFPAPRFEAEDVRVFVLDGESETLTTLHLFELSLEADDFDGPITLEARGEIDGAGFDLAGKGGALQELLQPTAPYPIARPAPHGRSSAMCGSRPAC